MKERERVCVCINGTIPYILFSNPVVLKLHCILESPGDFLNPAPPPPNAQVTLILINQNV